MTRCRRFALALVVIAMPSFAFAEQAPSAAPTATITPNPPAAEAATTPAPAPTAALQRRPTSPLLTDISAALTAERAQLERLEAEVRRTSDSKVALALQRQISQVKQNTEIELLRIQARHARLAGHVLVAEQIESAVREMLMTPEERGSAELARAAAPKGN